MESEYLRSICRNAQIALTVCVVTWLVQMATWGFRIKFSLSALAGCVIAAAVAASIESADQIPIIRCFLRKLYPELQHSADIRPLLRSNRVLRKRFFVRMTLGERAVVLIYSGMVCAVLFAATSIVLIRSASQSVRIAVVIVAGIVGAALPFAVLLADRKKVRRRLREEISALGHPLCIHCGYDLRGMSTRPCPECGSVTKSVGREGCV